MNSAECSLDGCPSYIIINSITNTTICQGTGLIGLNVLFIDPNTGIPASGDISFDGNPNVTMDGEFNPDAVKLMDRVGWQ